MKILTIGVLVLNLLVSSCFSAQARAFSNDQFLDFMKKSSPLGLSDLEALNGLGTPLDVAKDGCSVPTGEDTKVSGDTWLYGARKNGGQFQLQMCVYKRHVISYMMEQLSQSDGKNMWAQMQITDNELALKLSQDKKQEENQPPEEIMKGDKFFI